MANASDDHIDSLYLKTTDRASDQLTAVEESADDNDIVCMVCGQSVSTNSPVDDIGNHSSTTTTKSKTAPELQKHLLTTHKVVIADIDAIGEDIAKYCRYWRQKLAAVDSDEWIHFCATITTNSGPNDVSPPETYYMIGGSAQQFPEDTALRERLKAQRLTRVLEQWERERNDTSFSRQCLFCRKVFTENRENLFRHLSDDHNFHVGSADNIVFSAELLDVLEAKVSRLQCLYCERTFRSWAILKEHMRKKGHKMVDPDNRRYDKYYLINYLSPERDWRAVKREVDVDVGADGGGDDGDDDEAVDEWNDWSAPGDEDRDQRCICLFCELSAPVDRLKRHLMSAHGFDMEATVLSMKDFYARIKCVNYIRRAVHQNRCHKCGEQCADRSALAVHLEFSGHAGQAPDACEYDSPDYYFPTFENDNLLHFLEDMDADGGERVAADNDVQEVDATESPLN